MISTPQVLVKSATEGGGASGAAGASIDTANVSSRRIAHSQLAPTLASRVQRTPGFNAPGADSAPYSAARAGRGLSGAVSVTASSPMNTAAITRYTCGQLIRAAITNAIAPPTIEAVRSPNWVSAESTSLG